MATSARTPIEIPRSSRKLFSIRHISVESAFRVFPGITSRKRRLPDGFETPLQLLRDVDLSIGYDLSSPPFERPFLAGATGLVSLRLSDYNVNSGTLLHFVIPTLILVQRTGYPHGR